MIRLVQKELRKTLLKYKLHKEEELFNRAYEYMELGKNALSRLCGMQKTASLNFCTPCELSWGNAFFPGPYKGILLTKSHSFEYLI